MINNLTHLVKYDQPTDINEWNKLAFICSNLQQSTFVDHSQAFFRQQAVYIQIYDEHKLIGGVKFYLYQSHRPLINMINRNLLQMGEFLVHPEYIFPNEIIELCLKQLKELIVNLNIVYSKHTMHYGYSGMMPERSFASVLSEVEYNIGYIDLKQSKEVLWSRIPPKRRKKILDAEKQNLVFCEEDNIEAFLKLIDSTYKIQTKSGPNHEYLKLLYSDLKKEGIVKLYFIKNGLSYIAGAWIAFFGKTAYYSFGGVTRDSRGAGKLLQWKLFLLSKENGYESYCLGQLASQADPNNEKFTKGITSFKRRFGVTEFPAFSYTFVHKTNRYKLWRILKILIGIK